MTGASFVHSKLFGAELINIEGNSTVWDEATLYGAVLQRANMVGASFVKADARFADFSDATVQGADFTDASMESANFSGADLMFSELLGTRLTHARFSGASLSKVNLSRADLRDAIDLTQAQIDSACADPSNPPRLSGDLHPPTTACFSSDKEAENRIVQRYVIKVTGELPIIGGICNQHAMVERLPDHEPD